MSRVGKLPVVIPSGVEVTLQGRLVEAKGPLGTLSLAYNDEVQIVKEDNVIKVAPKRETKTSRSCWGLYRNLIANMVKGVHEGYQQRLEIVGVGYRAALKGKYLMLALGYSHDIAYQVPESIVIKCEKPTSILISGPDKQKVGQVAAEIVALRPPEPYKGKGIRKEGQHILRKAGKKK